MQSIQFCPKTCDRCSRHVTDGWGSDLFHRSVKFQKNTPKKRKHIWGGEGISCHLAWRKRTQKTQVVKRRVKKNQLNIRWCLEKVGWSNMKLKAKVFPSSREIPMFIGFSTSFLGILGEFLLWAWPKCILTPKTTKICKKIPCPEMTP